MGIADPAETCVARVGRFDLPVVRLIGTELQVAKLDPCCTPRAVLFRHERKPIAAFFGAELCRKCAGNPLIIAVAVIDAEAVAADS